MKQPTHYPLNISCIKLLSFLLLVLMILPVSLASAADGKGNPGQNHQLVARAQGANNRVDIEDTVTCRLIMVYGGSRDKALETARRGAQSFQASHDHNECLRVVWVGAGNVGDAYISKPVDTMTCPHCGQGDFYDQERDHTLEHLRTTLQQLRVRAGNNQQLLQQINALAERISPGELKRLTPAAKTQRAQEVINALPKTLREELRESLKQGAKALTCQNHECRRVRYRWVRLTGSAMQTALKRDDEGRKIQCYTQALAIYHGEKKGNTESVLRWIKSNIKMPLNRLILWSCYGSRQINAASLADYFANQNQLIAKNRKDLPCACQCSPEVYTAEDLILSNDMPQVVQNWIDEKRQAIQTLERQIVSGTNPRGMDQDTVRSWKEQLSKMKKAKAWLLARLEKARQENNPGLRTTGLSMPLGIDEDYTRLILQAPTLHFRRYTGDGGMQKKVSSNSLFHGVPITVNRKLAAHGIRSEYRRLKDEDSHDDAVQPAAPDDASSPPTEELQPTEENQPAEPEPGATSLPDSHPPYSGPSARELREKITQKEAEKRRWESAPSGRERTANLNLIESDLTRLQKQLSDAETAETIDPRQRIQDLQSRLQSLEARSNKSIRDRREIREIKKTITRLSQ